MHERPEISALHNPYNFSKPVLDRNYFVGREKLVDEIWYYLDQADVSGQPVNLALLGPRASGKTSLLNLIEWEAEARRFPVARVDLDQGDSKSAFSFFFKLFDSVFRAVCAVPAADSEEQTEEDFAFGGRFGETFDAYMDLTLTYRLPQNRKLIPFSFPVQYAKVMSAGDIEDASFHERWLQEDLRLISAEVGRPIVVLLDEGTL